MSSHQWSTTSLRSHWNKVAQSFEDFSQNVSTFYYRKSEIDLINRHLRPQKGKRFLKLDLWNEVNNTRILSWVAKKGVKIFGIDISDYLVETTKKNFSKEGLTGVFKNYDMRNLLFKDNYFDYIYTMGTIEHVPDFHNAVREIYRVLKPGCRAIIGIPNKHDPFLRPALVWFSDLFHAYPYSPEYSFTRRELQLMLRGAGFDIVADTGILFMPGIIRIIDIYVCSRIKSLNFIINWLLKPFEYLERNFDWPKRNGYLIACCVEKPLKNKSIYV